MLPGGKNMTYRQTNQHTYTEYKKRKFCPIIFLPYLPYLANFYRGIKNVTNIQTNKQTYKVITEDPPIGGVEIKSPVLASFINNRSLK